MIRIEVDDSEISRIEKTLTGMETKTPNVLKKAINDTAKEAKKMLVEKAASEYVLHGKKSAMNGATTIKNASISNLEATIESKGPMTDLMNFHVSPKKASNGKLPKVYKANVLTSGGMRSLQKGNIKAFVAHFASGHTGVVERVEGRGRYLRSLYGPAVPLMLGSHRVLDETEEQYDELLQKNIDAELNKIISLGG